MAIQPNEQYILKGKQIQDLASRLALTGEEVADKAEKAQTGSTAPTTSTPGEIGQLYIQSDGTVYILKSIVEESGQPDEYTWEEVGAGGASYTAGDGIDITNDVIKATNTGKAKELTTADYNWPVNNPTSVALWLLEPGLYRSDGTADVRWTTSGSAHQAAASPLYLVSAESFSEKPITRINTSDSAIYLVNNAGVQRNQYNLTTSIIDNLTSTWNNSALSANQGKVLKDLIDSLVIKNAGAPTTATVGTVGKLLEDTTNGKLYICTDATNPYVWEEVGAGGPTVVQTTGTSTTDVMSQNAVTGMVYADPSTKNNVQIGGSSPSALNTSVAIGAGTAAQGSRSVGIGPYANTGQSYSVALGASSSTSSGGEVSIGGANLGTHGYNNSSYRLLTNVYDPQSAHDAATKGYVDNSLLGKQDALTAGSGITIADESGSLVISTTVAEPDEFTSNEWNALWS